MDLTTAMPSYTPVLETNQLFDTFGWIPAGQYTLFWVIGILVGVVIAAVVWGLITSRLARRKGYRGYFWTGFFFWTVGLIYVVGLPLSDEKRLADMKKLVQISVRAGLR
jgi:hypothetical protein